jgi:alkanesulfonate monooxygenase SsuD/methylene tetrahydromethanopterin reductase-like flavin-dependent oxidoreductase (luciferase family)
MRFCDRAAASGFDGVSLGHHYLSGPNAQFFQPIPLAGHILAKYPNLYVATTIFVLAYHHPVEIAEQIATLDAMSPGRMLLGVGQGYRAEEAEAAGIDNSSRGARVAEAIAAMRLLWQDGPSSFEGEFFSFHDADIGPRPANPLGPPILAGADTKATLSRLPASGADYWLPSPRNSVSYLRSVLPTYQRALEEAGRTYDGMPIMRMAYVTDDARAGQDVLENAFRRMGHIQRGWAQPGEQTAFTFEELKKEKILFGTPEEVADGLIALNRTLGAEFAFLHVYTPGMDPEASLDMVCRIGDEVLPIVRAAVGTRSLFESRN